MVWRRRWDRGQGAGSKEVRRKPALAHRPMISQTWVYLLFWRQWLGEKGNQQLHASAVSWLASVLRTGSQLWLFFFFFSYSADRQIGEIKLGLKIVIHVTFIHVISNCTVVQGQPARVIRRFTEIAMLWVTAAWMRKYQQKPLCKYSTERARPFLAKHSNDHSMVEVFGVSTPKWFQFSPKITEINTFCCLEICWRV